MSDSSWTIILPHTMVQPLVQWYHHVTAFSTSMDHLKPMICHHFWFPNLHPTIHQVISSNPILPQVHLAQPAYGHLPSCNAPISPWAEVHVDMISPCKIKVNNINLKFNALACIDPVINLIKIICLTKSKTSDNIHKLFKNHWLSRYPDPLHIVHDHGPEFHGHDFQFSLEYAGITSIQITPHTPTTNLIIESSHHTIGQIIHTLIHLQPPTDQASVESLIDEAIATAMQALPSSPNTSLGNYSPGFLVFNWDMFLNIPVIAALLTLTCHC